MIFVIANSTDIIQNPVFDNKYDSLNMHQEAFVAFQQYIGTCKDSPKQFSG